MTENVFTVAPDTPLKVVATRMLEYGISDCPSSRRRTTCWESSRRRTSCSRSERRRTVRASWTGSSITARIRAREARCADCRRRHDDARRHDPLWTVGERRRDADARPEHRPLPVVDSGHLVGIVTRTDLVRAFTRSDDVIADEIREQGLLRRFWVGPSSVVLDVEQGNVVLEGRVDTEDLAEAIVDYVGRIPGVVSVEPKLTWPGRKTRRAQKTPA